jgi:erythrin-vacuolar iron transport family protein
MGFAEASSDNGSLTGRGSPWLRGVVCGLMTAAGGLGHALPRMIPAFWTATTIAGRVVAIELAIGCAIASWTRRCFLAAFQVVVGGLLAFATGILIGRS